MKIAVMGAGAMGGYFGGRLAEAGHDVWLIARGEHLAALKANGLKVLSPKGDIHSTDIHATDDPSEVGEVDVVFFAVKNRDVETAGTAILPMMGADSFAMTVQNGVSAWERLENVIGKGRVVPGVARMPGDIAEPGVIRHSADFDRISFGELSGERSVRVSRLNDALQAAGTMPEILDHILHDLWLKLCLQSTFASMTALTRLDIGPLRDCPESAALMRLAVEEAFEVGKAEVPDLPKDVAEVAWDTMVNMLPDDVHASMLDDLERGKPLELEYLGGEIVRLGQKHSIPTPVQSFLYAALKPISDFLDQTN